MCLHQLVNHNFANPAAEVGWQLAFRRNLTSPFAQANSVLLIVDGIDDLHHSPHNGFLLADADEPGEEMQHLLHVVVEVDHHAKVACLVKIDTLGQGRHASDEDLADGIRIVEFVDLLHLLRVGVSLFDGIHVEASLFQNRMKHSTLC